MLDCRGLVFAFAVSAVIFRMIMGNQNYFQAYGELDEQIENMRQTKVLSGKDWEEFANLLLNRESRVRDGGYLLRLEALSCLSNALKEARGDNEMLFRLHLQQGEIYSVMGRMDEATQSYETALTFTNSKDEEALLLCYQGRAYSKLGNHNEAITLLKKSLKILPNFLESYLPLVLSYRAQDKLTSSYWKGLMKEIEQKLKKNSMVEVDVGATDGMFIRVDTSRKQSSDVYWALYLIADKLEEPKIAWNYLSKAHAVVKTRVPEFDHDVVASQTQSIQSVFKEGFWPDPALGVGSDSTYPVFIVGMPRSGASVLEAMLAAHGEVYGTGDGSIYGASSLSIRNALIGEMSKPAGSQRIKEVMTFHADKVLKLMKEALKNDTSVSNAKKKRVRYVIDKTPNSFRIIGVIHYLFPKATIINMNRDPMDTILSCFTNPIADNETTIWSLDQNDLTHEYVQYLQVIDHYRNQLPGNIIDVSYEALVADPETTLGPVLQRLGLSWDPKMLDFHKQERRVKLHSRVQLSGGLSDSSIGRWTKYAYQLLPSSVYLRKILPLARAKNLVAYADVMNWDLEEDFEYPSIAGSEDAKASVETPKKSVKKARKLLGKKKKKNKKRRSSVEKDTVKIEKKRTKKLGKHKKKGRTRKTKLL